MKKRDDLVTVITVVYNGKAFIESTIQSVLSQTYPHIEYIIIDGGSTDGTVDIIKQYDHKIAWWISEPDKGVYDAMNKGIDRANGKWINFMNAGDLFYSTQSVEQLFSSDINIDQYAIIYGDAEFRLKNIAYISFAGHESTTEKFMPFSHQASFVRSDIAKQTKFDLAYKIVADSALSLRLIREGYQFKYIPVIVCSYDALQGLSAQNETRRSEEFVDMQIKLNQIDPDAPYFKEFKKDAYKKERLRKILPNCLWTMIREHNIKKTHKYRRLDD